MMRDLTIEIIFAEFGPRALKPDLAMVREYFPEAKITVFDDNNTRPVFDQTHPRYGWRMHDYYVLEGLTQSHADITISLDADMKIVSKDVRMIIQLTKNFGLCLPCNPRMTVRKDTLIGTDSDGIIDASGGVGYSFNSAIMAVTKHNANAVSTLFSAQMIMLTKPGRLPLALWRAVWAARFYPCLLPPQWCVCEGQEGCGEEIILHVGHEKVRRFYDVPAG